MSRVWSIYLFHETRDVEQLYASAYHPTTNANNQRPTTDDRRLVISFKNSGGYSLCVFVHRSRIFFFLFFEILFVHSQLQRHDGNVVQQPAVSRQESNRRRERIAEPDFLHRSRCTGCKSSTIREHSKC